MKVDRVEKSPAGIPESGCKQAWNPALTIIGTFGHLAAVSCAGSANDKIRHQRGGFRGGGKRGQRVRTESLWRWGRRLE